MALFKKKTDSDAPFIVVLCVAGQDDGPAKFCFPVGPGTDVIGRDDAASIQVVDPKISREHASICFDAAVGGFVVWDLESANGTCLNGRRLTERTLLSEGDLITAGNSRLVFTRRRFEDHVDALLHFKKWGEHEKSTIPGTRVDE